MFSKAHTATRPKHLLRQSYMRSRWGHPAEQSHSYYCDLSEIEIGIAIEIEKAWDLDFDGDFDFDKAICMRLPWGAVNGDLMPEVDWDNDTDLGFDLTVA